MDPPAEGSDRRGPSQNAGVTPSGLRRYGLNFSASSLLQAPLAALLEYSGVVQSGTAPAAHHPSAAPSSPLLASEVDGLLSAAAAGDGEVSIRIQGGPGDTEATGGSAAGTSSEDLIEATAVSEVDQASAAGRGAGATDAEANGGGAGTSGNGGGDRAYQRYDVHHVARWIEQILPFSLLLLVVFIRQHLQGSLYLSLVVKVRLLLLECCAFVRPHCGNSSLLLTSGKTVVNQTRNLVINPKNFVCFCLIFFH